MDNKCLPILEDIKCHLDLNKFRRRLIARF